MRFRHLFSSGQVPVCLPSLVGEVLVDFIVGRFRAEENGRQGVRGDFLELAPVPVQVDPGAVYDLARQARLRSLQRNIDKLSCFINFTARLFIGLHFRLYEFGAKSCLNCNWINCPCFTHVLQLRACAN